MFESKLCCKRTKKFKLVEKLMRCLAVLGAVILLLNSPEKRPSRRYQLAPVLSLKHFLKRIFYEYFCQQIYSSSALIKFLRCHDN